MKNRSWWEISNKNSIGEIKVFGDISRWSWDEASVSLVNFDKELQSLKNCTAIELRINSNGGSVYEAVGMFNTLKRFSTTNNITTTTYIEGIAASAASFLALASDKVVMGTGCKFMIHNPLCGSHGNSEDLRKVAEELDKIKEDIIDIYMTKTKLSREEISDFMDKESFFSTKEAIEYGFVDEEMALDNNNLKNNLKNIFTNEVINKIFPEIETEKIEVEDVKMTKKELKEKFPELLNEIKEETKNEMKIEVENKAESLKTEIVNETLKVERERIKNLDELKPINKKQEEIIAKAKFENFRNAEDLIIDFYRDGSAEALNAIEISKAEAIATGTDRISEENLQTGGVEDETLKNVLDDIFGEKK